MADKQLSALTAAAAIADADLFYVSQSGNSRKATGTQLKAYANGFRGALVYKSADQTTANYTTETAIRWQSELYDTDSIHGLTATVTVTIASPGVVTWTGHSFPAGTPIVLTTTGALPTGLTAGTTYYVVNPASNTFQLAATPGGAAINTTGSQSGVHTGTNDSVLVVPASASYVEVVAEISITQVTAGSDTYLQLYKNGSVSFTGNAMMSSSDPAGTTQRMNVKTAALPVTPGDQFQCYLSCADSSITVDAAFSWFALRVIA